MELSNPACRSDEQEQSIPSSRLFTGGGSPDNGLLLSIAEYIKGKEFDQALELCDKLLARDPVNETALFHKACILDYCARFEEAIRCYERLTLRHPSHQAAWLNKGFDHALLGQYEEAVQCFNQVLAISPSNSKALYFKGIVLVKQAESREADTAPVEPIDHSMVWLYRGGELLQQGKYEEADECFDRAIAINYCRSRG